MAVSELDPADDGLQFVLLKPMANGHKKSAVKLLKNTIIGGVSTGFDGKKDCGPQAGYNNTNRRAENKPVGSETALQ